MGLLRTIAYHALLLAETVSAIPASGLAVNVRWTAFGDSYAAGVGAGTEHDPNTGSGKCRRRMGAYPALLNQDGEFARGNLFDFLACTGAVIDDFHKTQIGAFEQNGIKTQQIATISIGGNDAFFAEVLDACILKARFWLNCEDKMQKSANAIQGIADRLYDVYDKIFQKVADHSGTYDFRLYVTGEYMILISEMQI
jgi:lysophospholipase L1-like esterase